MIVNTGVGTKEPYCPYYVNLGRWNRLFIYYMRQSIPTLFLRGTEYTLFFRYSSSFQATPPCQQRIKVNIRRIFILLAIFIGSRLTGVENSKRTHSQLKSRNRFLQDRFHCGINSSRGDQFLGIEPLHPWTFESLASGSSGSCRVRIKR